MASGGQKPAEILAEVGAADDGAGKRVYRCPELGPYLLCTGPVGCDVRVGDVGNDPPH